jgi:surface protein
MRKNRANNGYIGKDANLVETAGVVSPSAVHQFIGSQIKPDLTLPSITPTSGSGSGATAVSGVTNGILNYIYAGITGGLCGGSGYIAETPIRIVGGGETRFGFVSSIYSGGAIQHIFPSHYIESITVVDSVNYSTAPTVTISSPASATSSFTASIDGATLSVTAVSSGSIAHGALVSGTGVASGTTIVEYGTGAGNTGTYVLNNSQTVTSRSMTTSGTATAVAIMENNRVAGVSLTYRGTKYSIANIPTVTFSPSGAVAQPVLSTYSGYTGQPSMTPILLRSGSGSTASGANFVGSIQYSLDGITVTDAGSGYSTSPSAFLEGFEYSIGLSASVSGGAVSGISFANPSSTFLYSPIVDVGGWAPMPEVTEGSQIFVGTYAIFDDNSNYVAFRMFGTTYDVAWGDGTTGTFVAGATAQKQYTSATYAGITANPFRGYKTLNIIASATGGGNFTSVNLNVRHPALSSSALSSQWLNIKMAGASFATITVSAITQNIGHVYLEKFEFVGPKSFGNNNSVFNNCFSLREAIIPRMFENSTANTLVFSNCYSLQYVSPFTIGGTADLSSFFNNCRSLENAPQITRNETNNLVSATINTSSMFSGCHVLKNVPSFNTQRATSMNSMFLNCRSLTNVPFLNTSTVTDMGSMFSGCYSLEEVPYMDTASLTTASSMFASCYSLKTIPKFNFSKVTTTNSMFQSCYALKEIPLLETSNVTDMATMFSNCNSLRTIPKLDTRRATTINSMFLSSGIESIPNLDLSSVTSATDTFSSSSIRRIDYLNMPRCSTVNSIFSNCQSLNYVGVINIPSCVSFTAMFSNCLSLQHMPQIIVRPVATATAYITSSMFSTTTALKEFKLFNTTLNTGNVSGTSYLGMFTSCTAPIIPEYDFSGSTGSNLLSSLSGTFASPRIRRIRATGFSQSFSLNNPNMMGATALNELYANLATVGASGANAKTITITGSLGTAGDDPGIAIAKGWAVTG